MFLDVGGLSLFGFVMFIRERMGFFFFWDAGLDLEFEKVVIIRMFCDFFSF